jgi:hypothetical protein
MLGTFENIFNEFTMTLLKVIRLEACRIGATSNSNWFETEPNCLGREEIDLTSDWR